MSLEAEERQDVTIFWDIETTFGSSSAAMSISTSEVITNLREALAKFGPLRSIRAYWDYAGYPNAAATTRMRSELSSSGVMLIDCPGEGRKSAAMKKMLVDLILAAWDYPTSHTFVVITSDRDIAYALAMLRMRHYRVILMSPAGSHTDLTSQASINLNWSRGILGLNTTASQGEGSTDRAPSYAPQQATSGLPAPSAYEAAPPPTAQLRRNTLSSHGSQGETNDVPSRGRRQPIFSKSLDANYGAFGDLGSAYLTPPKTMASLGLGEGPLFPRSQSFSNLKSARSGSAPPHVLNPDGIPNKPFGPRRGSDFAFSSTPPFTSNLKGKEREFPVFEPEGFTPQRPAVAKARPSWISSTFEPFDEDERPYKKPLKDFNTTRKDSVVSISSVESMESGFSLLGPDGQQTTAPTSADQDNAHKYVDSGKTTQSTAPATFTEEPVSLASSHQGAASPRLSRSSSTSDIVSQPPFEPSNNVAGKLESRSAPPPVPVPTFKTFPSTSGAAAAASPSPAPPAPAPLPARAQVSPPQNSASTTTQSGPSTSAATPPTRTSIPQSALPATWLPLIVTLRNNQGTLPNLQLPVKLLKSYPSAYSLVGKSKYGKYIDQAVTSGIVLRVSSPDGPAIRLKDVYA